MKTIRILLRFTLILGMLLGASAVQADSGQAHNEQKDLGPSVTGLPPQTLPANNSAASPSSSLERIGHLGGNAYAVALQGNYAYLATQGELAVVDISDPAHPVRVGYAAYPSYSLPGYIPKNLIVAKGYAYFVNYGPGSVEIVDVSNPFKPSYVGRLNPREGDGSHISGIAISGDYAYLTEGNNLQIYDLSQPDKPRYVASFPIILAISDYTFTISNHYAYLLGHDSSTGKISLEIIDLTNPEAPQRVGMIGMLQNFSGSGLAVQGNYVYIIGVVYNLSGEGSTILQTVDVSNPALPVLASSLGLNFIYYYHLVVVGQNLYAVAPYASPSQGVLIFSLQDPSQPVQRGSVITKDIARDLAVTPDSKVAFVAEDGRGLRVVDVSDPGNTSEIGAYDPPSAVWSFGIARGFAFVSSGMQGIRSVDLSDPTNPKTVGFIPAWGHAYDLHVSGDFAFAAELDGGGIRIYNIANLAQMVEVASVGGNFNQMTLSGGYLYAWQDNNILLTVIDVSDPTHPVQVGTYRTSSIQDVALIGQIAYIATGSDGCQIVDFADPGRPKTEGQCTWQTAWDIEISGGYAYLMTAPYMLVFDISNPLAPVQVRGYSYPVNGNYALSIFGDLAFLYRNYIWNLIGLDISDPRFPRQVLNSNLGSFSSVIREGDTLYLGGDTGLSIMRLTSNLSGRVVDASSYPVSGAQIQVSSGVSAATGTDGSYLLANMAIGSYTITPTLSGFTFIPLSRDVVLPADDTNQDFTLLPEPVSITAIPGITATLVYTGYQGNPTSFEIPPGAFTQTAQVIVTPTVGAGLPGWAFTGHAFDLAAQYSQGPVMEFSAPVPVTIAYSDFDIRSVIDESMLALYRWDGSAWTEASVYCSPAASYTRDLTANQISLPICQTGKYALYGPTHAILLPVILMNFY